MGRGVIAEVERGGTPTNNQDLKDLWKAHIAADVQHLFLIVPHSNWRADGTAREKPFKLVARRLSAFSGDERREIDLLSAHVFAYWNLISTAAFSQAIGHRPTPPGRTDPGGWHTEAARQEQGDPPTRSPD
ncbi:hypothetical protein NODU109028_19675 [Nocardioides dubius]|uniref:Uncharacterized protein n=1 Tax=Nocardioides dubius TaxID=317019 RepID=A0ABN1U4K3_9ACTN